MLLCQVRVVDTKDPFLVCQVVSSPIVLRQIVPIFLLILALDFLGKSKGGLLVMSRPTQPVKTAAQCQVIFIYIGQYHKSQISLQKLNSLKAYNSLTFDPTFIVIWLSNEKIT